MKLLGVIVFGAGVFFLQLVYAVDYAKEGKIFLLEDTSNAQWCAYAKNTEWSAAVQDIGAMAVGELTYINSRLLRIDVTETDETGDWIVYDHYFLNDHEELVKLSRLINVAQGDRRFIQVFSIKDGRTKNIVTKERRSSASDLAVSSKPEWLPDVLIYTRKELFPFSGLFHQLKLMKNGRLCVHISGSGK